MTKQPTARKIETARKEKPELTKHATEAVIKSNTKAILNKEKDLKPKENILKSNNQNKNVNSKIKETLEEISNKEKEEITINREKLEEITDGGLNFYKERPQMKIDQEFIPGMRIGQEIEPGMIIDGGLVFYNGSVTSPIEIQEKKKVNYLEKIKGDIWRDNILE